MASFTVYRKKDIRMPIFHKLIYKSHMILVKIQIELFMELVLMPKFMCKSKNPSIAKAILKKKNKG